ncbi:hypothetical protein F2Q70_00006381 [Brassica cretica]|uniref:Uncharacterized protein n=1 Tax=Brassica cretica TaxID=69181 RepID=A0A8S9J2R3_BRACR|nr:hypothetical protein F2Q70_00006381 [Brassica cretica]
MAENQAEKRSRRGLLGFVFGRRGLWSKKCTADNGNKTPMRSSNASAPCTSNIQFTKSPGNELNSKKLQEYKVLPEPIQNQTQTQIQRPISKPLSIQYPNNNPGPVQQQARKVVPRESIGLSGELESMIMDNQKAKGMMFGSLGNLKQPGTTAVGNQTTVQNSGYGRKTMEGERQTPGLRLGAEIHPLSSQIDAREQPIILRFDGKDSGDLIEALHSSEKRWISLEEKTEAKLFSEARESIKK